MSTGFENADILGSSFGSFNSQDVGAAIGVDGTETEDVDKLLSALEATTHEDSFLKSQDDDLVKELLWSEKQNASDQKFSIPDHHSVNSLGGNSLGGNSFGGSFAGLELPEPLGLDEAPSDPNLLANLAHDMSFQSNSTKLDHFVANPTVSAHNYGAIEEEQTPQGEEDSELYSQPAYEPVGQGSGKRRRAHRRGSLPSMHLHYEDPFEPTPFAQPLHTPQYMQQPATIEPPTKLASVETPSIMSITAEAMLNRKAQRRGSLPNMHLSYNGAPNFSGNVPVPHQANDDGDDDVDPALTAEAAVFAAAATRQYAVDDEEESRPRKMGTGRMQRRGSTGSFYSSQTPSFSLKPPADGALGIGNVATPVPENLDPEVMMKRLEDLMKQSVNSQKALQKWDKDNGLPKSHSQTMVNTSRSRKQLQDGVILPKWDGTPLISQETELGKPKPRSKPQKKEGGRMKRRMSAPVSSYTMFGS